MKTCPSVPVDADASATNAAAVLADLEPLVHECVRKKLPISAEARMDAYFQAAGDWDGLDLLDLGFRIERRFGVLLSDDDWQFLSGADRCKTTEEWELRYAPLFTFGRLAELIAARLQLGVVEPVTVLGVSSRSAGAFRKIESIVRDIDPSIRPFAPSTPILERLRGRTLENTWARLRVMSGNRVPPLPSGVGARWSKRLGGAFGVCLVLLVAMTVAFKIVEGIAGAGSNWVAWLLTMTMIGNLVVGVIGVVALVVSIVIRRLGRRLEGKSTLLPAQVQTFRDLAELLAGDRAGFCAQCEYELTGVQSDRCPECGTPIHSKLLPTVRPASANC